MTDDNDKQQMTDEKVDREAKVLLIAAYALTELRDLGLVHGPELLSEEGRQAAKDLQASGFEPTDEELFSATTFLCGSRSTSN